MAGFHRHSLISYQPLKLLFQLTYTGIVLACLPSWIITALVRSFRPHSAWTVKQSFFSHTMHAFLDMISRIGITEKQTLRKGKEGDRFHIVQPAPSEALKGPLLTDVKPAVVGGTWFPSAPRAGAALKTATFLYFHGGAYVLGDGRIDYSGFAANNLVEHGGADAVFSVQYRLSGRAGLNPFPAALQDALASYLFLLRRIKIPAGQIILCGDSAGGNLAIALLRYIQEFGAEVDVPAPKCVVLLSPWVAPFDYEARNNHNYVSDILPSSFLKWGAHALAGNTPGGAIHPYITPLGNPFATPTPIFVNTGTAELFIGTIWSWVEEMSNVSGNTVEIHYEAAACHDTFSVGNLLGFEESARKVTTKIKHFVFQY